MSNNRNKKKLTTRQLNKIIILIPGIFCVLVFALLIIRICSAGYFSWVDNPYEKAIIMMTAFICPFLVWFMIYIILYLYTVHPKVLKEEMKEEMSDIAKNLSKNSFTEIYYKFQNSNDTILVEIVKNNQCKFYAKLDEDQDDNIIIIAKNKSEEEVYRTVTKNPKYFLYHFSLTEN